MALVDVTDAAASRVKALLDEEGKTATHFLRIKVVGGGCSGFQYELAFDAAADEDDHTIGAGGIRVVVDPKSALFLKGSTLDYLDGLMESGFKITNPNATSTCGCGQSFGA